MAVEYPEAPRRQHEEADARRGDPDQVDGQLVAGPVEAGCQQGGKWPGEDDPEQRQTAGQYRHEPCNGACDLPGLLVPSLTQQPGVDGDERRRQRALAQQVLEHIGNSQCGGEGVGGRPECQDRSQQGLTQ